MACLGHHRRRSSRIAIRGIVSKKITDCSIEGLKVLIKTKFTAYGLAVAVAFVAAVMLVVVGTPNEVSATKGATGALSQTITNASGGEAVNLKSTHQSGTEACIEGTFAVAAPTGGTVAAPSDAACVTIMTTVTILNKTTDLSATVTSTTGFPASGSIIVDNDGNNNFANGDVEVIDYTSITKTSIDGMTRARAGTTALALAVGADVWPAVYTTITIAALANNAVVTNVADASGMVAGGTTGSDIIMNPTGAIKIVAASAISGNTITHASIGGVTMALGEFVVQISGDNTDSATAVFTRTAATTTAGTFTYTNTTNGQTSTKGTATVTIITDKPTADATSATVSASEPKALPVIVSLTGSDTTEAKSTPSFTMSTLPTKGVMGTITAALCTDVALAKVGSVMTNCTSTVIYTPLLGATGSDSAEYKMVNGGETSVAAAITITLPAAAVVETVAAASGFDGTIVAGVNLTTHAGGTVTAMAADAVAAGATSVSVTSAGSFIVHVVGAPSFVNQAFTDHFTDGVPASTVMLVVK
jgi:hypothetical protein